MVIQAMTDYQPNTNGTAPNDEKDLMVYVKLGLLVIVAIIVAAAALVPLAIQIAQVFGF